MAGRPIAYAPALHRFASTALTASVLLLWSSFLILLCRKSGRGILIQLLASAT